MADYDIKIIYIFYIKYKVHLFFIEEDFDEYKL